MMMETVPSGTILHNYYRIERVLGSGGFGHVYLSIDLRSNQQYALKEYLVSGPGGQEQLQHEAQMLSKLHHPNLPMFHDAFSERGRYYIVLSYIEGNDLTDLLRLARMRNEAIPLARLLNWMITICDAVTFLHSQRPPVIHRDIKPDNIRVTSDGTAILVDLGNAKAAADGIRTLLFIRHQGTPGYAPPEQYPGGAGTDIRSDVYALGGTLYFALTTYEPPSVSARNTSIQQGQVDLPSLQQRLASNPPEDAADPQRSFRLGVSKPQKPAPRHSRHLAQLGELPAPLLEQLNRIIMRAMALRPEKRYQSVLEMSNDLKKVQAALPASQAQAAPSPRPVDPHSTQPDLPQLYEAVQAAKEQATRNPATSTPAQAKPTVTCPRCGAIITDQAAYCRVCGTPLPQGGNTSNPSSASNQATTVPSIQKPASSSPDRSLAEEETIEIRPQTQVREQSRASQSTPPSASASSRQQQKQNFHHSAGSGATGSHISQTPAAARLVLPPPAAPAQGRRRATQFQQPLPVKNAPAAQNVDGRGGISILALFLVIIVLAALIALLIIFLTHHGQHSIAALSVTLWTGTGALYERSAPADITPPSAFAWLWTCCAGIAAAAGFA